MIDWVMRTEGVSFRHAVELLRAGAAGRRIRPGGAGPALDVRRRLPAPVDATADDAEVLAQVVDYYHATLLDSPEALGLPGPAEDRRPRGHRGLPARLRQPDPRATACPHKQTKAGAASPGPAAAPRRASAPPATSTSPARVVVPVIDSHRRRDRGLRAQARQRPPHRRSPPTSTCPVPHRGVWNEAGARRWRGDRVRVAHRRAHASGAPASATSPPPTAPPASPPTHREAFARHEVTRVLIAYDHDDAGDAAAASWPQS